MTARSARRAALFAVALLLAGGGCAGDGPGAVPQPRPEVENPGGSHGRPGKSFELVAIGDFGNGSSEQDAVAAAIEEWVEGRAVDALVTTGDNIYPIGHPEAFDEAWHEPYGWVQGADIDLVASLGNHDVEHEGGAAVMELLRMPDRWYSRVFGDAEVFVLDGNDPGSVEQRAWLEGALRSSGARWKIAAFHQPAYSCSEHDGTPAVQEAWVPLLEKWGVDVVLNGHDHNYQRFVTERTTYVVTGGGGARLYGLDGCPEGYPERVAGNDGVHHFLALSGSRRAISVSAIAPDGSVLDRFKVTK